ncbi:MAG: threonine-phosphate decarboxylase CobD [Candidatus Geothermincolia bacterium]
MIFERRHGADPYEASRRYGIAAADFLDFSTNVNPLGPPAAALDAARQALARADRYPDPSSEALRRALSDFCGVPAERLCVGNGSTELIYHLMRELAPARVCVAGSHFSEYAAAARACGAELVTLAWEAEADFEPDKERLQHAAETCDVLFLCNPGTPHGRLYTRARLMPALEACRRSGALFVTDESFLGFCPPEARSVATLLPELDRGNLAVLSTVTKLFALAGLRGPGYLACDEGLRRRLESATPPWRVNVVAEAAAMAAMQDTGYRERTLLAIPAWRRELTAGLAGLPDIHIYPSEVNYLLLRLAEPRHGTALVESLAHRGILVRDCSDFTGLDTRFVRVAVRPPDENERLLASMQETIYERKG